MRKLVLLVILALCIAGCTKNDSTDPIIGKWELTDAWGTFDDGTLFVDFQAGWKTLEFTSSGYVFFDGLTRTEYEKVADDDLIIWTNFQGLLNEDHYIIETLTDQDLQLHFIDLETIDYVDNSPYHYYYKYKRVNQ